MNLYKGITFKVDIHGLGSLDDVHRIYKLSIYE